MTAKEVLAELKTYGHEGTKNILMKHGAKEPFFGVKVADLKKILKKTKKNHKLSLELYKTGNSDAMYLAGLMADETQITKAQLNSWVKKAYWQYLSEYTVPWVASETEFGKELALEWIENKKETIAAAGWATLSSMASIKDDKDLDIKLYKKLLKRAEKEVHTAQNRVRYAMNGFIIATGAYIKSLTDEAIAIGERVGKVHVDVGGTACKVPLVPEQIEKVRKRGSIGKKRKTARC